MAPINEKLDRREFIKYGSGAVAAAGSLSLFGNQVEATEVKSVIAKDKPVTFLVLGSGSRGNTYAQHAFDHPEDMQVIAVADPHDGRRNAFVEKYKIPKKNIYLDWKDALAKEKIADAVIISTPDILHYEPAMRALELGYDVLLEKPIAPTAQECINITQQSKKYNKIIAICHVLRYTPYYRKMKEIIDSKLLGDVVTIEHTEAVNYWHQAHSYVRGNWRNLKTSSPMILAKSCHDLDIIRWLIGDQSKKVASFGSLSHFKLENAPPGSTARCTDGCAVERTCPYSAIKIYLEEGRFAGWPAVVLTMDNTMEGVTKALKEGPYGRCVYRCDNDVVDHQVVSMEFAKGKTASFTMAAFNVGDRRSRVMGTMGEAIGDSRYIEVVNFRNKEKTKYDTLLGGSDINSGHGGGDAVLIKDFVRAVRTQDSSILTSTIDASLESHLMAFASEESRLEGKIVKLN